MSTLTKILIGFGALVAVLAAIVLVRTFAYGGALNIPDIELPDPPAISEQLAAEHLGQAVRFKTVTYKAGDPAAEDAQPWLDLHAWLEATYPDAHRAMKRETVAGYTLLYTWTGSDASLAPILLMAHQDVVPVNNGTLDDWDRPPFSGDIANGYVYGRGALDDKGSMVALMEAANALAKEGFQPIRTIHIMFGHDEEVSGSGARDVAALLESRGVRPELVLDEGFFVIENDPLLGKTTGFIGVAEKGYTTLELVSNASGGHSSTPPRESANVQLARAIIALEENQMPANFSKPPVSNTFQAIGSNLPFGTRMALANLWLFRDMVDGQMAKSGASNAMVRTTTAPTMLTGSVKENVLPQNSVATVNFRVHPNDTVADVIAHVERQIAHIDGIEVRKNASGIGSEASPVSPIDNKSYGVLNAIAKRAANGGAVVPALVLGATDARWMVSLSDNVYRFAPSRVNAEDLGGFHGTNERLAVGNVKLMAEGYAQLMMVMGSE